MDPKNTTKIEQKIDTKHLKVTGAHHKLDEASRHLLVKDDVLIIVTHAFGPQGDSLVGIADVTFDGYPAITLKIRSGEREGLVHLSPFHGDPRKVGMEDLPAGSRCELLCPVSGASLDRLGKVSPDSSADYYAVYLTPRLSEGEVVAVSNIWGDYHSRIVDNFELISAWTSAQEASAREASGEA